MTAPSVPAVPLYYDDYGDPSKDPNVVNGRNIGEPEPTLISPKQLFDYIVKKVNEAKLMGKKYENTKAPTYVCTDFAKDVLNLLGLNVGEYFPGADNYVSKSAKLLKKGDYIKPVKGKNPESGVYVFYKVYKNGIDGHTGIVYFDEDNKTHVLHNGATADGSDPCVNIYDSKSTNFNNFFPKDKINDVIYKQIDFTYVYAPD